jgi:transcriptional regulator with XRE-family HTH domain
MDGLTNIFFNKTKMKEARLAAGLSLTDAAGQLGLSKQQLWNYENEAGRGEPSPDTLARACVLYGIEISDLTAHAKAA